MAMIVVDGVDDICFDRLTQKILHFVLRLRLYISTHYIKNMITNYELGIPLHVNDKSLFIA